VQHGIGGLGSIIVGSTINMGAIILFFKESCQVFEYFGIGETLNENNLDIVYGKSSIAFRERVAGSDRWDPALGCGEDYR
jgi:hypothetical protein